MSDVVSSRRRFFEVIATGGTAFGAACLGVGCVPIGPSGKIAAGNVSALAVPSLQIVPDQSVAIGRDEQGVYAMTLICTDAACDIATTGAVSAQQVSCFCHGSVFSPNGAVLQGPASSPLEHFEVTIDDKGAITIDASNPVAASVRVPA